MEPTEPVLLGLLGAVVGSFLAVAAVRWPEGRSVVGGRSCCDACGRTLRAWELVPLVSALALRGRCARCGASIAAVHAWTELGGLAVGVAAGLAADGTQAIAGATFGWLLLLLAVLDLRALWLPDRVTGALAAAGLAAAATGPPTPVDRLIGGAAGYLSLRLLAAGYRTLRGREGLGGGDPKMFGAIGLWLGWRPLPAVAALAVIGRAPGRGAALPFGALLAAAAYPAWIAMVGWLP